MGPDHVQMTKVNWKNIQKYFTIKSRRVRRLKFGKNDVLMSTSFC